MNSDLFRAGELWSVVEVPTLVSGEVVQQTGMETHELGERELPILQHTLAHIHAWTCGICTGSGSVRKD